MTTVRQSRLGRLLSWLLPYRAFTGAAERLVVVNNVFRGVHFAGCVSLHRWILCHRKYLKVYLHCWEGDDWSKDLHDHSATTWSIGLKGSYDDVTAEQTTRYRAPWIRKFPATHTHRIVVVKGPVWTLVVTGKKTHASAFVFEGKRMRPEQYMTSARAAQRRAC